LLCFSVVNNSASLPVSSLIPGLPALSGHIYDPDKAYQIGHEHSQLQIPNMIYSIRKQLDYHL
jgi:hypothetical protein